MSGSKFFSVPTAAVAAWTLAFLLSSCGSSDSKSSASTSAKSADPASGSVVARVEDSAITKAEVNHWMLTLAGEDYYELSHKRTIPGGLISEPPNYALCVSRLEAAIQRSKQASISQKGLLLSKCRQMYQALRMQSVEYLVNALWTINLYEKVGIRATELEVKGLFDQIKPRLFPTSADLNAYLAQRRLSLADEMFVVKLELLSKKGQSLLHSGGQAAFVKLTEAGQKLTAQTNCRTGYVVPRCEQYVESSSSPSTSRSTLPSAAVLMEQVATLIGVHCTNRPACAKQ